MYCLNCGESWEYCICIPWCWEHDSARPCRACDRILQEQLENEAMLAPFIVPWYRNLFRWIVGNYE